ncbi:MAG: nitroreductase family protein [Verrucomicrobia bacterium]|nr:nitroreductase family protein [Verrucomicrobiota bacterium]
MTHQKPGPRIAIHVLIAALVCVPIAAKAPGIRIYCGLGVSLLAGMEIARAAELPAIQLPAPDQAGGRPLMAVLKERQSIRDFYAAIDAGFISQNVYLYCASAGLATVAHELDRPPLAQAMRLRPEQKVIIAQSVGYPK